MKQPRTEPVYEQMAETVVAGFCYYDGEDVWERMKIGDKLNLYREPGNRYDRFAVAVYWRGIKLGYVPRRESRYFAELAGMGQMILGQIGWLRESRNPWRRVGLNLWLVNLGMENAVKC